MSSDFVRVGKKFEFDSIPNLAKIDILAPIGAYFLENNIKRQVARRGKKNKI